MDSLFRVVPGVGNVSGRRPFTAGLPSRVQGMASAPDACGLLLAVHLLVVAVAVEGGGGDSGDGNCVVEGGAALCACACLALCPGSPSVMAAWQLLPLFAA